MTLSLRTLSALLADANAAESLAERERCLAAAEKQASSFHGWDAILEGLPATVPLDRKRTLVAAALESARKREEIWGFRSAARFLAGELGDLEEARLALVAAERMLVEMQREGRALGFYWGVLAEAFQEALGDERETLRCLEVGWTLAWAQRDVEDLGRLVNQWSQLADRPGAIARLRRVEEAAPAWGKLGGLIYWWHALGDAAAARRVRQTALESATRFDEALELARFWNLYESSSPGLASAFARAEALAASAADWFALARVAREKGNDLVLSRRALDRAASLSNAPGTAARLRVCIAAAYADWFADDRSADRLGPRGVRPDDLHPPRQKLTEWDASASALFDWLRRRVTREQLEAIARADYGRDVQRHLAGLETICKSGLIPLELAWHPGEVLELARWSSGEKVDHLGRALSCAIVSLSSRDDIAANTGPILIESCLALGDEAAHLGERLLAMHCEASDPNLGEGALILWLLFVLRAARAPGDPRLVALLQRISLSREVGNLREAMAESQRAELWARLIESIVLPLHQSQPALSPLLRAIGFS